jgi:hypothetical protein
LGGHLLEKRTNKMKTLPKKTKLQSILFDRAKWSASQAKAWLTKHKKEAPKTDVTTNYLRYRQKPPYTFQKGSFRYFPLSKKKGIFAVIARPRKEDKPKAGKKKTTRPTEIKKGVLKKMAAKSTALAKKEVKKPRKKKNPSIMGGINFGSAFRDLIPLFCGAIICKFTAKKFVEGGGDREDWDWKNYALGLAGTIVAAFLSNAVFKGRGRVATLVFKGGLLLFFYKLFVNELVPKSSWLESWFGQAEDIYPDMSADMEPDEGDVYQDGDGRDHTYGADRRHRPVDEMHRQPAVAQMGVVIEPADPNFGYEVVPASPTFGDAGELTLSQRYAAAHAAAIAS